MKFVDRGRIEELLQDESRSLRDIAREVGCSDWTVRSVARKLRGDLRPMKHARNASYRNDTEPASLAGCAIGIGLLAALAAVIWYGVRGPPPPD